MKDKNIWIMNHYATGSYFRKGGRPYWFAKNLIKQGYKPTIFCANTRHNGGDIIKITDKKYATGTTDGISYVFIKTTGYEGNGLQRIKNMWLFYKNFLRIAKKYAQVNGKPNIILASSVHPLTLVAGIKMAKRFDVPCICEVRDLWPESFVAYNIIKRNNPLLKLLYAGERWIYKKADKLIFTMEGGSEYITDKKWDKEHGGPIDLNKVHHINNGVDLEWFEYNKNHYVLEDEDLENNNFYKIVYTGSLRQANDSILKLLEVAKLFKTDGYEDIKFLIYGKGDEKEKIEKRCKDENLTNIKIKGHVDKKYIPYILSCCDLNILNCSSWSVLKYGGSQNKLFEYLASGNPTISGEDSKYSIINNNNCGISRRFETTEDLKKAILEIKNLDNDSKQGLKENVFRTAQDYDYTNLTNKLINIIESCDTKHEKDSNFSSTY